VAGAIFIQHWLGIEKQGILQYWQQNITQY